MASSTQFMNKLGDITWTSTNSLNQMGTKLREAGLVEKGGRGKAARISANDARNILICLLSTSNPEHAVMNVRGFSQLGIISGDLSKTSLNTDPPPKTFGQVIKEMFLVDSWYALGLVSVRISRSFAEASILFRYNDDQFEEIKFEKCKWMAHI